MGRAEEEGRERDREGLNHRWSVDDGAKLQSEYPYSVILYAKNQLDLFCRFDATLTCVGRSGGLSVTGQ